MWNHRRQKLQALTIITMMLMTLMLMTIMLIKMMTTMLSQQKKIPSCVATFLLSRAFDENRDQTSDEILNGTSEMKTQYRASTRLRISEFFIFGTEEVL